MKKGLENELGLYTYESSEEDTFLGLQRTVSLLDATFLELFKTQDITGPQYNILSILSNSSSPLTLKELMESSVVRVPDLSRMIDRLENNNLVTRNPSELDKRSSLVTLTSKGKRLVRDLAPQMKKIHQAQFSGLTKNQLKELNGLLAKLRQGLSD